MVRNRIRQQRQVYLLRIWEERSTQPPYRAIRLSLEPPDAHTRRGFNSPEALAHYLNDSMAPGAHEEEEKRDGSVEATASGSS
jgi:hypothetical protein